MISTWITRYLFFPPSRIPLPCEAVGVELLAGRLVHLHSQAQTPKRKQKRFFNAKIWL